MCRAAQLDVLLLCPQVGEHTKGKTTCRVTREHAIECFDLFGGECQKGLQHRFILLGCCAAVIHQREDANVVEVRFFLDQETDQLPQLWKPDRTIKGADFVCPGESADSETRGRSHEIGLVVAFQLLKAQVIFGLTDHGE